MNNITLPLSDLYSPIRQDLAVVERIFDDELRSDFPFVNDLCTPVRSCRGKMLRPTLLLLSGQAAGGLSSAHHTLGAVVEMVHAATLAHDDVLDEADERRGQLPANRVVGNVAAVLLGDYLISHAFHLCSSLASQYASRRIGSTTNAVCEGELLQNQQRGNADLSEEFYLEIIGKKTGALTATSCELGAHEAAADSTVIEALRSYGMSVGVAFQIIDDVLDLVGDRGAVRKTLRRDLALGKATLPTIHCLTCADAATASRLRRGMTGEADLKFEQVRDWLMRSGSIDYAISTAQEYVADAVRRLDIVGPSDAKTSLIAMAEFIV
ncbi:MAG: polyprenyl synthetase family protein, partial [Phycisphaerae bacterium]